MVDDEDFDLVNQFKWCAHTDGFNWYAERALPRVNGRQPHIKLHQFLLPGHPRVDHKDGDGLNNQRHNLRPATHGENISNSRKYRGCSSEYKGVTWHKRRLMWESQIVFKGEHQHLGYFESEIDAAKAYDQKAKKLRGEFAKVNFP